MITIEQLKIFCGVHDKRIMEPFSHEGRTYATNGFMVVRVPALPDVTASMPFDDFTSKIDSLFADYVGEWIPVHLVPDVSEPCSKCDGHGWLFVCPECDGVGNVLYVGKLSNYDCECPLCRGNGTGNFISDKKETCSGCDGTGRTEDREKTSKIGVVAVADWMLRKIAMLPDAELLAPRQYRESVIFRFSGGEGVVMGMRQK